MKKPTLGISSTITQKSGIELMRKNLYSNPAVSEYNRTTDSANKTVATLIEYLETLELLMILMKLIL